MTAAVAAPPGDAACFYHAGKLAVVACEACGRFLCGLCDIEYNTRHLCAPCLETRKRTDQTGVFESRRLQFDSLALILAAAPVLFFPLACLSVFTAPAALFLVVRFWRRPMSILPRTRVRFILAFFVALSTLIGWGALVVVLFRDAFKTTVGGGAG